METFGKKIIRCTFSVICLCLQSLNALADSGGTDQLADPTRDLFATFLGTGINILLLMEIVAAAYIFTSGTRKMSTWVGIPILILVTSYARVKFGS